MKNIKEVMNAIETLEKSLFNFSLTKPFELVKDKHQKEIFSITNLKIELDDVIQQNENLDNYEKIITEAFEICLLLYSNIFDSKDRIRKSIFCPTKKKRKLLLEQKMIKN